ncbi:MAG: hypothetical protein ACXWQQ_06665 [Pseudobdellovibrio sp.]
MNLRSTTFALVLINLFFALSAKAQNLNQFYTDESNANYYQQQYAAAPSGSWEESQARQSRDLAIQRAIQDVSTYSFQGMPWQQIESFADQLNQKYAAAPSGGAIESMYRQVRDTSYQAFNQALQSYVQCFSNDWRQVNDLALQMDQKYAAAPSGSQKESAYNQARQTLYQRIPSLVDQELSRMYNFRDAETMADYFSTQYVAAPSGSLKESIYLQVRNSAYSQAQQKFSQQAYSMGQQDLWQVQDEYNRKYTAAASGSTQESYYRQIRDTARSLIHP